MVLPCLPSIRAVLSNRSFAVCSSHGVYLGGSRKMRPPNGLGSLALTLIFHILGKQTSNTPPINRPGHFEKTPKLAQLHTCWLARGEAALFVLRPRSLSLRHDRLCWLEIRGITVDGKGDPKVSSIYCWIILLLLHIITVKTKALFIKKHPVVWAIIAIIYLECTSVIRFCWVLPLKPTQMATMIIVGCAQLTCFVVFPVASTFDTKRHCWTSKQFICLFFDVSHQQYETAPNNFSEVRADDWLTSGWRSFFFKKITTFLNPRVCLLDACLSFLKWVSDKIRYDCMTKVVLRGSWGCHCCKTDRGPP